MATLRTLLECTGEIVPLTEAGLSRLLQIMHGDVPRVNTLGFITAENPGGVKQDAARNRQLNQLLKGEIDRLGLGYQRALGSYGAIENPFIVRGISREQLLRLADDERWQQASVIFGERTPEGMTFYELDSRGNEKARRRVFVVGPQSGYAEYARAARATGVIPRGRQEWEQEAAAREPTQAEYEQYLRGADKPLPWGEWRQREKRRRAWWGDMYSEVRGQKFKIPLYDPPEGAAWKPGDRGVIDPPVSYVAERLLARHSELRSIVEEIQRCQTVLDTEGLSEKAYLSDRFRLIQQRQVLDAALRLKGVQGAEFDVL